MSRQKRRREKRKNYHTEDSIAERENGAIRTMQMTGNVQQPRLNRTYSTGGFVFFTGKNHRKIG